MIVRHDQQVRIAFSHDNPAAGTGSLVLFRRTEEIAVLVHLHVRYGDHGRHGLFHNLGYAQILSAPGFFRPAFRRPALLTLSS